MLMRVIATVLIVVGVLTLHDTQAQQGVKRTDLQQHDLSIVKRIAVGKGVNAEFRLDALNVFDNVNFSPQSGITVSTTTTSANWNRAVGSTATAYETTALTGVNTSRILQLVARVRW